MVLQLVRLLFWALIIYTVGKRLLAMMNAATAAPRVDGQARPVSPPPPSEASPYDVLGVTRTATATEIRSAYQGLMRKYHPDLVATMPVEFRDVAEKKTKEINAAYAQLKRWGALD